MNQSSYLEQTFLRTFYFLLKYIVHTIQSILCINYRIKLFDEETVNNEQKMHSFHPLSRVDKSIFFHLHLFYTGPFTAIIENDIVRYVH